MPEEFDPFFEQASVVRSILASCPAGSRGDGDLFDQRLAAAGFTETQVQTVRWVMGTVCSHCWDADNGCHCTRDD
jgi:hypothetical protein